MLVSRHDGEPFATHLPLLVEPDEPPAGQLVGHMARANPQWRELADQDVLAVFAGPHAYVSPSWYEGGRVVPTWNYTAVHVYGRAEIVDDEPSLVQIVAAMVNAYEGTFASPWQFDAASPFVERLLGAIVGFRVAIERIEGKWKLGQNQPEERRKNAAGHLAEQDDPQSQAIARLMLATCGEHSADGPRPS